MPAHQVGALQVDFYNPVPDFLSRGSRVHGVPAGNAGAVHQNVHAPVGVYSGLHHTFGIGGVGNIPGNDGGIAACSLNGRLGLRCGGFVQVGDRDFGAFPGEHLGRGAAYAGASACNQDYLVLQSHLISRSPVLSWAASPFFQVAPKGIAPSCGPSTLHYPRHCHRSRAGALSKQPQSSLP